MQRQQSKKANKMQSQRAAPRNQSKNRPAPPKGTTQGPYRMTVRELPSTVATTTSEPVWLRFEGKVNHPELGGGVRIAGRQLLASVTTTAGDNQLLVANGATLKDVNAVYLSPDTLNGRLALQARAYDRYVFRKVRITFVSRVPTSQVGSFALGYVNDPVFPSPTFANVTSMCPAMQTSFYGKPTSIDVIDDMASTKTYYCLYDASTTSTLRQTVQGTVIGIPDTTSIGAVNHGFLWIDYLIDLYQPTLDQGFTLRLSKEEEESIVKARSSAAKPSVADVSTEIGSLQLRIQQLKSGNLNL